MINGFAPEGPYNFAGVQDLDYTDGVKAAMFALCTAIILFIQQIPWWGEQNPVATNRGDKVLMVLNQYQGGMCISGVLKTTERTAQHLISPLGPKGMPTDSAV